MVFYTQMIELLYLVCDINLYMTISIENISGKTDKLMAGHTLLYVLHSEQLWKMSWVEKPSFKID